MMFIRPATIVGALCVVWSHSCFHADSDVQGVNGSPSRSDKPHWPGTFLDSSGQRPVMAVSLMALDVMMPKNRVMFAMWSQGLVVANKDIMLYDGAPSSTSVETVDVERLQSMAYALIMEHSEDFDEVVDLHRLNVILRLRLGENYIETTIPYEQLAKFMKSSAYSDHGWIRLMRLLQSVVPEDAQPINEDLVRDAPSRTGL